MDTSDLVKRGARSLLVDLCKQIEEVVKAVPDLERFARDLVRETLGYKPTGAAAHVNGTARARLSTDLEASRKLRTNGTGTRRKAPTRSPWTAKQRAEISKRMRAYWAEAKRAGVDRKEQGAPSRAEIEAARAKAKAAKTNNNHSANAAPASGEATAAE